MIQLLIIDPQNDFCDRQQGALYVKGADDDMRRLAAFVRRNSDQIAMIHVTLDSHRSIHVAHPVYWQDRNGRRPLPFTVISASDVRDGHWAPAQEHWLRSTRDGFGALDYVMALEESGKQPLRIWPPHCLVGSWGHNVYPPVLDALHDWEARRFSTVNYVMKGANCHTEHYSAFGADVPDPTDSATHINADLLRTLNQADEVLLAGEAASHCLASTVVDADAYFHDGTFVRKLILLSDTTSCIDGCESQFDAFLQELTRKGMRVMSTVEFEQQAAHR